MRIRKTRPEDIEEVMQIYARARSFMAQTGNPTQWDGGYPHESLIREDIEKGISHVAEYDGKIETVFVFFKGEDPTYRVIENGSWVNDEPYGVIHRIASRGEVKGAGAACLLWGFEQCGNLRIDTHDDNLVMQHVLEKNGFVRCGRIYLEDGSPRVAYQKVK
jgi:RimJ/RimL family protein N-acetyltransferase